jgi:CubicO group peptidase (beta-lactamase class C family)
VSGQPFARHVQETILAPFGMTASSFVWRPEYDAVAARGHDSRGQLSESWVMRLARQADAAGQKSGKPTLDWTYADAERALQDAGYPVLPAMVTPNAAGSLFTTAGDYALFLSRLLEKRPRDEASLSDALRAEMRKAQIRAAGAVSWGLGVGLETDHSPPVVWHWGDSGSAQTFALGDPATGDGVVVLTNSSRGLLMCERVVAGVNGRDHAGFLFP